LKITLQYHTIITNKKEIYAEYDSENTNPLVHTYINGCTGWATSVHKSQGRKVNMNALKQIILYMNFTSMTIFFLETENNFT
jgi:hypothetical protein